jgi:hypothetical protein
LQLWNIAERRAVMREILFRGKTEDGSRWVYGMPCATEQSGIYAIQTLQGGIFDIIPETIGQYTGLTDKNGKKIFEGDIVEYKEEYGEIAYDDEQAMFSVLFDTWCTDFDHIYSYELEVIGNIHDNPEFLKGEQI